MFDQLFSSKFHRQVADYFTAEKAAVLVNFLPESGLRDAMALRDVDEVAIRGLNGDHVIFDIETLEVISEYRAA
jgi:hypothetical protein